MDFYFIQFLKSFILPPGNILLLLLIAILLMNYNLAYAKRLFYTVTSLLYLASLPIVSGSLIGLLEDYPALTEDQYINSNAEAIVILGGGRERDAAEFGGDIVSLSTFERLRYGSFLHSKTQLPILVTGGFIDPKDTPEGVLMARSLEQHYKIAARWQENRSRNTAENAIFSYQILQKENIDTIMLVSKARHLPRAVPIFEEQGFKVIPAPTGFVGLLNSHEWSIYDFLPAGYAIQTNSNAIHELLGRFWYFIRY